MNRIKKFFNRQNRLDKLLMKEQGINTQSLIDLRKNNEQLKELYDNSQSRNFALSSNVEGYKCDINALENKIKDLKQDFTRKENKLMNDLLQMSHSKASIINDFKNYRSATGLLKSTLIKLIDEGHLVLSNEFKLFINALGLGAERNEDLLREGLFDYEIKDLVNYASKLSLVKPKNGFYELTSIGYEVLAFCDDCERIDYGELIDNAIGKWGDYLVALEARDNTRDDDNDRLLMYKDTSSLLEKLCPDNRKVQKDFDKEWNVIKRCVRLEYDNGFHAANYRRSEVAVKNILKLINNVKDDYLNQDNPLTLLQSQ